MPELFPYQEEGARFLAARPRAGLFDKPRVGKTPQAIRALDYRQADRNIIVCPAAVREGWVREFQRFGTRRRRVVKGNSIHDFVAWANGRWDTLVCSYDMAVRWTPYVADRCELLDAVVLDEGHRLKAPATRRSLAMLGAGSDGLDGLAMWAEAGWWLTGTPVPNDPMDIYTFLRFARVMPLMQDDFRKRYMHVRSATYGIRTRAKDDMAPELRALIGNNSMTRALGDTGVNLPPIFLTTYPVDGSVEAVRQMILSHPGLDAKIVEVLQAGKGFRGLDGEHIATLRRLIGEAKAVPYSQMLVEELDSGLDKIVVFAHHKSVLATVKRVLDAGGIRCGMVVGETSERDRQAAMDAFQTRPEMRVLLCNIRTAGEGLNLTAACHIDMLESDWAPMQNFQALMRVYGMTQTRNVLARTIFLANSFDEVIAEIIADKTRAVGELDMAPDGNMAELMG